MGEKLGIENLKKVVDLGIEAEKLTHAMIKNGKNWTADVQLAFADLPVLVADVQGVVQGAGQVIPEAKDLDEQEAIELVTYIGAKLAVENEKAKAILAASLKLAADLIIDGVALSKAIRA